jgi:hypothetical protein
MLRVKKIPSWNGNTVWDPVEFLHVKKNEMPLTSCNPFPLSIFPKFPCTFSNDEASFFHAFEAFNVRKPERAPRFFPNKKSSEQ